jgi:protein TonB
MFEDSLMESSGKLKTKRGWTTFASLAIQIGMLCVLVLIPLIYTEALPKQAMTTLLVAPPPPPPPPPPPAATPVKVVKVQTEMDQGALHTPTKIPDKIKMIKEEEAPQSAGATGIVGGVAGGVPGGALGGVIGGLVGSTTPAPKVVAAKPAGPQRISGGVASGNLITKVQPQYPAIAKAARIQGAVVLAATISKSGTIENLHVVSGHPMLVQAAMDAVKQWRYKPFLLSGEPTEVETTITVNFNMNGGTS